jgi:hypothetical protein
MSAHNWMQRSMENIALDVSMIEDHIPRNVGYLSSCQVSDLFATQP